jgi:hypothetical protein
LLMLYLFLTLIFWRSWLKHNNFWFLFGMCLVEILASQGDGLLCFSTVLPEKFDLSLGHSHIFLHDFELVIHYLIPKWMSSTFLVHCGKVVSVNKLWALWRNWCSRKKFLFLSWYCAKFSSWSCLKLRKPFQTFFLFRFSRISVMRKLYGWIS